MEKGKTPRHSGLLTPVAFLKKCDQGMVETLSLFGRNFGSVLDVDACIRVYALTTVGEVVKFIKNFVSFWAPYSFNDDLPPGMLDAPYGVMSSQSRSFFRNTFGSGGRSGKRIIYLAQTLVYSKRLFTAVPKEFVDEKLRDYGESLSREDPESFPFRRSLETAIEREIDSLGNTFIADFTKAFTPSTASCIENTRSQGGVQSYVRELLNKKIHSQDDPFSLSEEFLFGEWADLGGDLYKTISRIDLLEKRLDKLPGGKLRNYTKSTWNEIIALLMEEAYSRHYDVEARRESGLLKEQAAPVGLLEPLKVRIITRQSWSLNLLKPIQECWHSALRRTDTYQLVGHQDVQAAIQLLPLLRKGEKYVSGDYEAATDNIYLWATEFALRALFKRTRFKFPGTMNWFQEKYEQFLIDLSIQSFNNLQVTLPGGNVVDVKRGQMMGNILSFPLLCIINGAATRLALGPDSKFIVNGDDVAFTATPQLYKRWKHVTSCVGLKFSLGKNYFARNFIMINSQYFVFSQSLKRLERVQVANVGLLNSASLLSCDDRTGREILPMETLTSLWKDFELTLTGPKMKARGERLFLKRYHRYIKDFPGSPYGPRELGCLGMEVPVDHRFTRMQRIWMEAHRTGSFSFREGRRTEYARITSCCQRLVPKLCRRIRLHFSDTQIVGPPQSKYFDFRSQTHVEIPDPYSRGGGFENMVMPLIRWFTKESSESSARVHVWRRWRRFLNKNKTHPILSDDLDVELNSWRGVRRCWSLSDGT